MALKYRVIGFTYNEEGSEGRRNFSVDVYRISKDGITVRYEADEELKIRVFQTLKNGIEVEIPASLSEAYNETRLQSNLDRRVRTSEMIRNWMAALRDFIGIGTDIAAVATGAGDNNPFIDSAMDAVTGMLPNQSSQLPQNNVMNEIEVVTID